MIIALITAARPRQWTKNLIIFAGLIFSQNFFHIDYLRTSILAFVAFCLAASSVYIINDLKDLEQDRLHPIKKNRPLAAGKVSPIAAVIQSLLLSIISISLAFWLNYNYGLLLTLYWIMMIIYSFRLKHLVIVDILIISMGFIIRAVSGAVVLEVMISRWLLACAIFLSLFLILAKRRIEIVELNADAVNHRAVLEEYGERFLDQMIAAVTACTIISYVLYTVDPGTVEKFQTNSLIWTVPFVIYGIFRYLYLVYQRNLGSRPEMVLLTDKPTMLSVLLWILVSMFIVY
ncbi:decaprenyl-phosphate phosphoribosyltransferase [candidate division LCP-89 bacterium B3_LCP]|uniref:Decaprenyl-phosphate phosphoribosyltransferase n=1 Tax=candidate division LCP-89 bacterium B3_LCP TaxID=2012998 RepID=A0A532V355_UNCL8|nr:MAG: decaprenyl-phosphate phosphoribosyltransferase [candidate division LCP-89 bacterium B3_LCP]